VAVLTVVHEVDAGIALAPDHVGHRGAQLLLIRALRLIGRVVGCLLGCGAPRVEADEVLGPRQASGVAGQDPVGHLLLL
jgi:hypothetical protein